MDMVNKKDVLQLIQQNISFILVGTTHPGNIGAAARAMKNMGIPQMGLVSPKEFPHEKAFFRAPVLFLNVVTLRDRTAMLNVSYKYEEYRKEMTYN